MSALPAPLPSDWAAPVVPLRPVAGRSTRPGVNRERSPHSRMIQSVLTLFPGAEVVEHFPAPRALAPAED